MKKKMSYFTGRMLLGVAGAVIATGLGSTPGAALAATISIAPGAAIMARAAAADRIDARVKDMHATLKITAAQEGRWSRVADVMRSTAKTMDVLARARVEDGRSVTALDDLKSYAEIADARASGLKKFTAAFANLYASLTEAQKKEADKLFRDVGRSAAKSAYVTNPMIESGASNARYTASRLYSF